MTGLLALTGCASDLTRRPLEVVSATPADGRTHPADQPLRVRFDGYLDPAAVASAVRLTSAELSIRADALYDPVERAVVVVPSAALRPHLGYRLRISADLLSAVDGRRLAEDVVIDLVATEAAGPRETQALMIDFDATLAPAFARRCGCHGPAPKVPPTLRPVDLVGAESLRRPGRLLVEPGAPLASELLLRVLPDYPGVRGPPMPPEGPGLSPQTTKALVSWVEGLAR